MWRQTNSCTALSINSDRGSGSGRAGACGSYECDDYIKKAGPKLPVDITTYCKAAHLKTVIT